MNAGTFSISMWCLCGASMKGSGPGNYRDAASLQTIFWSLHSGEGHGPSDAKQAANTRRRYQQKRKTP